MISVVIPGKPRSWHRNRLGKTGRPYRPAGDTAYRDGVVALLNGRGRLSGPVGVKAVCVFARPGTRPKSVPPEAWDAGIEVWRPTVNCDDADRLAGLHLDALAKSGVLRDDGVVCRLLVEKVYAAEGDEPHVRLEVWEL